MIPAVPADEPAEPPDPCPPVGATTLAQPSDM
jgi:hypothetical protein